MSAWRANPFLRMVPFTIFQRLSSLGSGGGVKAGTIPSQVLTIGCKSIVILRPTACLFQLYSRGAGYTVTIITR